jgi:hypothetical protein
MWIHLEVGQIHIIREEFPILSANSQSLHVNSLKGYWEFSWLQMNSSPIVVNSLGGKPNSRWSLHMAVNSPAGRMNSHYERWIPPHSGEFTERWANSRWILLHPMGIPSQLYEFTMNRCEFPHCNEFTCSHDEFTSRPQRILPIRWNCLFISLNSHVATTNSPGGQ